MDVEEHASLIKAAVEYAARPRAGDRGHGRQLDARGDRAHAATPRRPARTTSLSVVPYYNKPMQEGLYRHFKAIAESSDIPMILYNVPSRTVADLQNDTVAAPGRR